MSVLIRVRNRGTHHADSDIISLCPHLFKMSSMTWEHGKILKLARERTFGIECTMLDDKRISELWKYSRTTATYVTFLLLPDG